MRVYNSTELSADHFDKSHPDALHLYNGLDCCVTAEVITPILDLLDPESRGVYDFEKEMQGPALDMMLRGIRVNPLRRDERVQNLRIEVARLEHILNQFSQAVWDGDLNANSPQQLKAFFYGAMGIEPILRRNKQTGERVPTCDRSALEKIRDVYFHAKPFVNCILAIRDRKKKISVLTVGVDRDLRMRVSFNVAGTETGRWSSSIGAFGSGTNIQNITEELRDAFIADDGMKMAYIDLEQAESWCVGLFAAECTGKENYLDAIRGGDLHTTVSKLVWPEAVKDRKSADAPYYRQFTYRDMGKRGGHGTNYYGTPYTMASHLKVPPSVMEEFQVKYFGAFPEIREWHFYEATNLQTKGWSRTPFGRKRWFMGRRYDDATLREAIANRPQSTVADALNSGLLQIYYAIAERNLPVQLLAQVHDAILLQYPEALEDELLPELIELVRVPFTVGKHTVRIPAEAKVGWNWGNQVVNRQGTVIANPDGLRKYRGHDPRQRTERGSLDFVLHGVHKWAALAGGIPTVGGDFSDLGSASPEGLGNN